MRPCDENGEDTKTVPLTAESTVVERRTIRFAREDTALVGRGYRG